METNTNSLLRDFDTLEKTETTLEELRNSDDWEQALIVITEDSFPGPYALALEMRTYLTTRGSAYFDSNKDSDQLPGINLSFTDYNPFINEYIEGKHETVFKVEKCYKLRSTYDISEVLKCIDNLTSVTIDESDEELEDTGDFDEVLMEDEVDEVE